MSEGPNTLIIREGNELDLSVLGNPLSRETYRVMKTFDYIEVLEEARQEFPMSDPSGKLNRITELLLTRGWVTPLHVQ
jgi:hypothetical protein